MRDYKYTLQPVTPQGHNRPSAPPVSFLDSLVDAVLAEDQSIFAKNDNLGDKDIYNLMPDVVRPLDDIKWRMAVMLEILRRDAGYEANYDWQCGADTTAGPETPEEEEAGVFQVSYDSSYGKGLADYLRSMKIGLEPESFVSAMKSNRALAIGYAIRLFRQSTRWSGPANRGWLSNGFSVTTAKEFLSFL